MSPTAVEVMTMGRVSVDLYSEQIGLKLEEVTSFRKFLGGSATKVAVAAARLGHRTAVVTKVGDDPFGPVVRRALVGFGVEPRWVGTHPALRTPTVFCEVFPPDHFPLLFYREPQNPRLRDRTWRAGRSHPVSDPRPRGGRRRGVRRRPRGRQQSPRRRRSRSSPPATSCSRTSAANVLHEEGWEGP